MTTDNLYRYEESMVWVPRNDERADLRFLNDLNQSEMGLTLYERREIEAVREKGIVRKMIVRKR